MGRYLAGTKGFSYKYVFAEQEANLDALAEIAGTASIEPLFSASMDALERTDDLPVMELLRECIVRTGRTGGETKLVIQAGNDIHPRSFEFVMYAIGENVVPLAVILDERLPEPAQQVVLCARTTYELERADHPKLLEYVNRCLEDVGSAPIDLARLKEDVDAIGEKLHDVDAWVPFMALHVLHHAIAHDLDRMRVYESRPERYASEDFWSNVRTEWGRFLGDDAAFAEALVRHWEDGSKDDLQALQDPRAKRWLEGKGSPPLPKAHVRHEQALASIYVMQEVYVEWHEHEDVVKLDRFVRGKEVARDELRTLLDHDLEIPADLPAGLVRDVLEDLERVKRIEGTKDPIEIAKALEGIRWISNAAASHALVTMLDHGTNDHIALAYDVVMKLVGIGERSGYHHVAYNLACTAARLGRKTEMLAALRAAKLDGDHPRDALTDKDFAAWHDDPDLRALADEE